MSTTQITVRNVDKHLKLRINRLAKLKTMSINDFVLQTLREKVGGSSSSSDITWSQYSGLMDKGSINQSVLDDFEAIDPSMWKEKL
jgi:hypothetical protein